MAPILEQFSKQLADSGVISELDLREFVEKLPPKEKPADSQQLAKRLVHDRKISAYQAQVVYSGNGKSLTMGSYFVLDKLGQGGMGMVLKAEHRMMKRLVAIKVLSPKLTKTTELQQRFQREVEAAARLIHPNIVRAFDAGESNGSPFLVLEYVPGEDLSSIVKKKGPLSVDQAVDCIIQAARGLEFAHSQGVIHRDIKPANLLLDNKGAVKILDVGLARIDADDVATQADLTGTGAVMGTVDYMAPEQALSTKRADARSDLYSLGISLWYLLTAKAAYGGDSLMARLLAHREQPIPSLRAVRTDVSESLEAVFRKLVAKRRGDRYQTATELIAELERCRTGTPVKALVVAEVATGADEFHKFLQQIDSPTDGQQLARENHSLTGAQTQARPGISDTEVAETMSAPNVHDTQSVPRKRGGTKTSPLWYQNRNLQIGVGAAALLSLGVVIYLLQSPTGTLRVEILDPQVEVKVKGSTLTFHESDLDPVELAAGEKTLLVTRGELSFETDSFVVRNAKETRVKVELTGDNLVVTAAGRVLTEMPINGKSVAAWAKGTETPVTGWHGWPAEAPKPAIVPFDANQAKQHQQDWAKHLGVPTEYTNSIGMKFRLIPPGEFTMGSTPTEIEAAIKFTDPNDKNLCDYIRSEAPKHKVLLTQPFCMGIHEVTQANYATMMGRNPSRFAATGVGKEAVSGLVTTNHPVEMVSWNDAAEFCAKLSLKEKLKPFYVLAGDTISPFNGTGYRLPSEAEWESACRAGTATLYWAGERNIDLLQAGWFAGNSQGRTHAVGELKANPYGLFDTHGNVWEWVQDGWDADFYSEFQDKPAINPDNAFSKRSRRVIRGGFWGYPPYYCRSTGRDAPLPKRRDGYGGFRVALTVEAVKAGIAERSQQPKTANAEWQGWPANAPNPAIAPFDAMEARNYQEAWSAHLKVPVEYKNSIGMKFRLIPPGEFTMGGTPAEVRAALGDAGQDKHWQNCIKSETPQHKVILTQPIYVGTNEVTQAEFEKVLGRNPSHFSPMGQGKAAIAGMDTTSLPVEMVDSNDAAEFCAKLSQLEKLQPFNQRAGISNTPSDGTGYRLPTEAEWEFACRSGTTTRFWNGDKEGDLLQVGWVGRNSGGRTHVAGELKPNPFGLYDTHGNVWEWVQDKWGQTYYGGFTESLAINPSGPPAAPMRVLRGGTWFNPTSSCRSSYRFANAPTFRYSDTGFRVVLAVTAVQQLRDAAK